MLFSILILMYGGYRTLYDTLLNTLLLDPSLEEKENLKVILYLLLDSMLSINLQVQKISKKALILV